ncbi:MAG: hypothetical protein FWC40_01855 [Proteobacteria bacterium]|nr:hypothetical protein [Pseudomonadota bacterium]
MRSIWLSLAAVVCVASLSACGSVNFGTRPDAELTASNQAREWQAAPEVSETNEETQPEVDCDAFMDEMANVCYLGTAFEADGMTPRHDFDEDGNDLGEIDQEWAAAYCSCYAQLAFQTFGCMGVLSHLNLTDEEYDSKYESVRYECAASFETWLDDAEADGAVFEDCDPSVEACAGSEGEADGAEVSEDVLLDRQ